MLGLTPLGTVHTAISLVAVAAGFVALFRDKAISPRNLVGQVYIGGTILSCLTGFFIFQHGGFGKPHALGVITLLVLGLAAIAGFTTLLGRASRYVEAIAYSTTFFFHFIPGVTETSTRLPLGAPLVSSPDAPELQVVVGGLFIVLLVGAWLQVRWLRRASAAPGSDLPAYGHGTAIGGSPDRIGRGRLK